MGVQQIFHDEPTWIFNSLLNGKFLYNKHNILTKFKNLIEFQSSKFIETVIYGQ